MRLFKTSYLWATLAAILATAAPAYAQLQPRDGMEPKLSDRTGRVTIEPFFGVRTLTTGASVDGVCTVTSTQPASLAAHRISSSIRTTHFGQIVNQLPGASVTSIDTALIGPMPYASKIQIVISDLGSGSTPACTGYQIEGDAWNGSSQTEILTTTINESTRPTTSKSWSRVTRVYLTGCSGFDASDALIVRTTGQIALSRRLSNTPGTADVLSICLTRLQAGTTQLACAAPSLFSYDTDLDANTIDVVDTDFALGTTQNGCPPDNSDIVIKYRAGSAAQGVRTY